MNQRSRFAKSHRAMLATSKRITQNSRAFTLIEVLITALVAGVALTTIMGAMSEGFHALNRARETTAATVDVLDVEMERLRTLTYAQIAALAVPNSTVKTANGHTYTLTYAKTACNAVTPCVSGDSATYNATVWVWRVTVTVTWTSSFSGQSETRTATAYFANAGVNTL